MTLPDPAALPLSPTAQSMLALRDVVFRVWEQRVRERARITAYSHDAINGSIDAGIQEAVEGFALVHSGFRERFAAALTHDLRGPLAAAALGLELIAVATDPAVMKTAAIALP